MKEILKFAKAKSGKIIVSPNSRSIYLVKNRIILEGTLRFQNLIIKKVIHYLQYLAKII